MADNYLENKMEEHRRGGAPAYRRHLTPTGNKPGTAVFDTDIATVLIEGGERLDDYLEAVARRFKTTGARVAFRCADATWATPFAQQNSLVFIPATAAVPDAFANPQVWVAVDPKGLTACVRGSEYAFAIGPADTPAAMADALLLLSLPTASVLLQKLG